MDLFVSYQNRHRSIRAETFLEENLKKIEPLAARANRASAKLILEPDGSNVVQLAINSPKPFNTVVTARDENLYAAMHKALTKLRRKAVGIKERFISARRKKNSKESFEITNQMPKQGSIDAEEILRFERSKKSSQFSEQEQQRVTNKKISDSMLETSIRLKIFGADKKRVEKYEQTAQIVSDLDESIQSMVRTDCDLVEETNIDRW